jgi:hypothetical protein
MAFARWLLAPDLVIALAGCMDGGDGGPSYASGPGYGYGGGYGGGWGGGYNNGRYNNGGYNNGYSGDRWTSPRPGINCDRSERVCYDRGGPELSVTREYFGSDAARRLENQIGGNWKKDDTYNPQQGVRCDIGDEICQKKGEDYYKATRQQFGREAGQQVREPDGSIQPNKKTVCDPGDATCMKNGEINVDQTRYVFGGQAAKDARKEKQAQDDKVQQQPQRQQPQVRQPPVREKPGKDKNS